MNVEYRAGWKAAMNNDLIQSEDVSPEFGRGYSDAFNQLLRDYMAKVKNLGNLWGNNV